MRIERLQIDMLPGIEPGFSVVFPDAGVTVVTGPNGIGKSSLIRAMRWLLKRPQPGDPGGLALAADWSARAGKLTVRRQGSAIEWRQDGQPGAAPSLPDPDQWHCYWLSMETLLAAGQGERHDERHGDQRLDEELRRLMAGGFDLARVRTECRLDPGPRFGFHQAGRWQDAVQQVQRVEAGYDSLRRDEAGLPAMVEELDRAREAGRRVARLDKALAWLDAVEACRRAGAALADYPDAMSKLRGEELDRLEELRARRSGRGHEVQAAAAAQEAAWQRLRATGLEAGQPDEETLQAWSEALQQVPYQNDQREQQQARFNNARADRRRALSGLGAGVSVPDLSPDALSEAERLARELQPLERLHAELAARVREAPAEPSMTVIRDHREAAGALRQWLQAQQSQMPARWRLALAVASAGVLTALAAGVRSVDWLALTGVTTAVLALAWVWLRLLGDEGVQQARLRFDTTGVAGPPRWHRAGVEARLDEVESELWELERQGDEAREARRLEVELRQCGERLQQGGRHKRELAGRVGFDPGLEALGIDRFVRLAGELRAAERERDQARAMIGQIDDGLLRLQTELAAFLQSWQAGGIEDMSWRQMEAAFKGLRRRCAEATAARADQQRAARDRQHAQSALEELDRQLAQLYADAGLSHGEDDELRRRVGLLESWRRLSGQLRDARALERSHRAVLDEALAGEFEGAEELRETVGREQRERVMEARARAADEAARVEALQEEVTALRTRLHDAGLDRALEAAAEQVSRAGADLEDAFEQACLADVGSWLLDEVERDYRRGHEPDVLRRARRQFARFTRHAYELDWQREGGFRARDLRQQQWRTLGELSSGARMQLLLAVRLAWVEHLDHGREGLPVCLDEALTTTDEERFVAVAGSLEEWSRDRRRQVLYFSARRHEIALWQRATGHPPAVIDLAEVRFGRRGHPAALTLPEWPALPEPGDLDPVEYGQKIGVPPVDPRLPVGQVHLFHLLRDQLPLLHRLMDGWRVTSLGQLESLMESDAGGLAVGDETGRRHLRQRCRIVRQWIGLWRTGRGRPVGRVALEESGAVSATFIDQVTELADGLGGDGAALVAALRDGKVARFRADRIDLLERWLLEEGYVSAEPVLDADGRLRGTLERLARSGEPEEIRRTVGFMEAAVAGSITPSE